MDYDVLLYDRIQAIKLINDKYDLDHNAYLSFSGGKDSTVLHYLLDLALPGNRIPRVFINTGIEYSDIVTFVHSLADNDDRFKIILPKLPIITTLEKYGYPFKSKEHSLRVQQFNLGKNSNFIRKYMRLTSYQGQYVCPKCLMYQFAERGRYNYSNLCCKKLKKEPARSWSIKNNRPIIITGMRNDEGGNRKHLGCIITDNKTKRLLKFHPLIKVDEQWENDFIDHNGITLCKLYYPPFNFKRTGCKGCPFALTLKEQLELMAEYLPNERRQCEIIWKPVYDEYRRLGYRLDSQMSIFE